VTEMVGVPRLISSAVSMLSRRCFSRAANRDVLPRALKRAIDRGVDVQIVYHDTKKDDDPNRAASAKARLPDSVTHVRTRTQIPHNKFVVKLVGGACCSPERPDTVGVLRELR